MRRLRILYFLAAVLAATSPALAQSRAYICTVDGSGETFRVLIGPQEYRIMPQGDNDWGMNFCDVGGHLESMSCRLDGSKFTATLNGVVQLSLDTSSGEFFQPGDGMFTDDERGTCRPG